MQTIAVGPGKDWHRRPEGCAAVHAQRTDSVSDVLRAVIDGVLISNSSRERRREWAAADCLVIDARNNSGSLAHAKRSAIIVSDVGCRSRSAAEQLADQRSPRFTIGKENWITRRSRLARQGQRRCLFP